MWNSSNGWDDIRSQPDASDHIDWDAAYAESERLTKEKWAKLPPIVKGFYEEHEEVKRMSQEEVDKFRKENNNITVSHFKEGDTFELPKPAPKFIHSFHNHPDILTVIESQGFKNPSPIQSQSWPILLQGKDLIGIAQTGTGKTLAYLLPGLLSIVKQTTPRRDRVGPSVLILAPTRELAQQIDREAHKYAYQNIQSLCVYGGGDRQKQVIQYRQQKPEIVIATPGRLNDLTMAGIVELTAVNYLVLDEADRMLDLGFMPQIRKVMVDVRPDRQTVMMSATWPPGVRKIATDFMSDPVQIFVGTLDLAAVNSVSQEVVICQQEEKRQRLYDFLLKTMSDKDKAIVFVGRKAVADDISSELALNDIGAACMHGDRDQADREQALADIKTGQVRVIIATDVASRGLDIDDITYILNYDFPRNAEEYVHRVGRTGRAGRTGKSITFFTREDWRHAQELIDILRKSEAEIPGELVAMAERYQAWEEKKRAEDALAREMGGGPIRRGGFGGGTGGRNCYNCGESGHVSRDCPQPRRGGDAGGYRGSSRGGARGGGGSGWQARQGHQSNQGGWSAADSGSSGWTNEAAPGSNSNGARGGLTATKDQDDWW